MRTQRSTLPAAGSSGGFASSVQSGDVLDGRYRLVREIGSDEITQVWEAVHVVLNRTVAIKILHANAEPSWIRGQAERWSREAQVVSRIGHPSVIEILDVGQTPQGCPYMVMELLKGQTLAGVLRSEGAVPWPRARNLAVSMAQALEATHAVGVLHRDLEPRNVFVMVGPEGERCKLSGFGIARVTTLAPNTRSMTHAGTMLGSPAYASPEQIRGEHVDARADVYGMGALLYAMLVGRGPFDAPTTPETIYRQLYTAPVPPRQVAPDAEIPPALEAIVLRCLRKRPALRFGSMIELHEALEWAGRGGAITIVPDEVLPAPAPELAARYASVDATPTRGTRTPWLAGLGVGLGVALGAIAAAIASQSSVQTGSARADTQEEVAPVLDRLPSVPRLEVAPAPRPGFIPAAPKAEAAERVDAEPPVEPERERSKRRSRGRPPAARPRPPRPEPGDLRNPFR